MDEYGLEDTGVYRLVSARFRKVYTHVGIRGDITHSSKRWYQGDIITEEDLDRSDIDRLLALSALVVVRENDGENEEPMTEDPTEEPAVEEPVTEDDENDSQSNEEPGGDGEGQEDANGNVPDPSSEPEPEPEPNIEAELTDWESMDYQQLQATAKEHTGNGGGNKADLVARLTEWEIASHNADTGE